MQNFLFKRCNFILFFIFLNLDFVFKLTKVEQPFQEGWKEKCDYDKNKYFIKIIFSIFRGFSKFIKMYLSI